jgi:hypothetical protein
MQKIYEIVKKNNSFIVTIEIYELLKSQMSI